MRMRLSKLRTRIDLLAKRYAPVFVQKVRVRFFNEDGTVFSEGGDAVPSDDPADIIAINVMPLSPEEDAEIRKAHHVC